MEKCTMPKRIEWIDTAKVLTMLLVIIGHCNYYCIETPYGGICYADHFYDVSYVFKSLNYIIAFIYSFHMPLFMALSGMCFSLSKSKAQSLCNLIRSKAIRLLIPFIAVSLLLSIPLKFASGYWDDSQNILFDIICGQLLLMGNSHLWFIISLFWIFPLFYLIEKKQILGWKIWLSLIVLSWIGFYIESKYDFLGLSGAMKHLLFFTIGYHSLQWLNNYQSINSKKLLLSIAVMFLATCANSYMLRHYPHLLFLLLLKPVLFIVFALSGIFLFCIISKKLKSKLNTNSKWFTFLKRNTYELYLYSDPFNYVIIALCWDVFDYQIVSDNKLSLLVFMLRLIGTAFMAIILIKTVAFIKIKSITRFL